MTSIPNISRSILPTIVRIADGSLTARDFATMELWKVDPEASASETLALMDESGFDAAPLDEHPVWRFVDRDELRDLQGPIKSHARAITAAHIVPGSLGLISTIRELRREPYLFVYGTAHVDGIVTHSDLQRQPVAVGVLALILAAEQGLQVAVAEQIANWGSSLTEARLKKANDVFAQRQRFDAEISLLDCVTLDDLLKIVRKSDVLRTGLGCSGEKLKRWSESLRGTRDTLAHAGDLLSAFPDPSDAAAFVGELWEFAHTTWMLTT